MVEALVEQEINERSAVFKVPLPVRTKKTEETHNYRLTNLYEENNNEIVLEVLLANPQINYSGTSKIVEYFLDRGEVDRVLPLLDSISDSKILAKFLTILICRGDNVDWGLINNRSNKESILSETAFLLAEKGDFAEARRVIEDNTHPLTENYSNALPDSFKIASLALITYIEKGDGGILSFWVTTITSMTLDDSIKSTRIRIITNYLLERGSYEVVLNIISTESLATCRSYMREETKTLVNKFLESGDYDRAIIAGKLYPANTFPPIQGVIVKSLINAGKIDEAKTVTSSISDKIWRSSPLQEVALAYIKIGDYESAEAIIKGEAIDEHYKAGVLIELAAHNIRNNRRKEAKLQVEEVIRTNTKEQNVSHRNDLSPIILAYTECGMLSEAKQVAEQSGKFINRIDNFSYLNRKKCEYLTMVACGYARQGRFEEGLALLEGETSDEFRWFTIYANYLEYCAKEGLFEEFEKHTNYFSLVLQNDAYSMNGTKISDTQLATIIRQFHLAGKLNKLNTLIDDSLQTNLPDSTVKKIASAYKIAGLNNLSENTLKQTRRARRETRDLALDRISEGEALYLIENESFERVKREWTSLSQENQETILRVAVEKSLYDEDFNNSALELLSLTRKSSVIIVFLEISFNLEYNLGNIRQAVIHVEQIDNLIATAKLGHFYNQLTTLLVNSVNYNPEFAYIYDYLLSQCEIYRLSDSSIYTDLRSVAEDFQRVHKGDHIPGGRYTDQEREPVRSLIHNRPSRVNLEILLRLKKAIEADNFAEMRSILNEVNGIVGNRTDTPEITSLPNKDELLQALDNLIDITQKFYEGDPSTMLSNLREQLNWQEMIIFDDEIDQELITSIQKVFSSEIQQAESLTSIMEELNRIKSNLLSEINNLKGAENLDERPERINFQLFAVIEKIRQKIMVGFTLIQNPDRNTSMRFALTAIEYTNQEQLDDTLLEPTLVKVWTDLHEQNKVIRLLLNYRLAVSRFEGAEDMMNLMQKSTSSYFAQEIIGQLNLHEQPQSPTENSSLSEIKNSEEALLFKILRYKYKNKFQKFEDGKFDGDLVDLSDNQRVVIVRVKYYQGIPVAEFVIPRRLDSINFLTQTWDISPAVVKFFKEKEWGG